VTPAPNAAAERLRAAVSAAARDLLAISDADSARRPAPGKWSPREIVGHLVDSALHNHGRFVGALLQDDLVFPGYAQDAWVEAQRYGEAPWGELVALWVALNGHVARVIEVAPDEARDRPRARHNLHEIAFRPAPDTATLGWLMDDYVAHLEHHLRQVLDREQTV
jgi:hypothetical protein